MMEPSHRRVAAGWGRHREHRWGRTGRRGVQRSHQRSL